MEQYVEMVLDVPPAGGHGTDYVIRKRSWTILSGRRCPSLRREFIGAAGRCVEYAPLNVSVLTNEKWLLCSSLSRCSPMRSKYTPQRRVSITLEEPKTLCIP